MRTWNCGLLAKAQLGSLPLPSEVILSIDLANKYFVVLRGRGISDPRIFKTRVDFVKAIEGMEPSAAVGHEFPSETEARAYITAAGFDHYAGC